MSALRRIQRQDDEGIYGRCGMRVLRGGLDMLNNAKLLPAAF
jgi:hypothetical protein